MALVSPHGLCHRKNLDVLVLIPGSLYRAYTAVAMTKKLQGKRFPPAIVEAVVNDFKSRLVNEKQEEHPH